MSDLMQLPGALPVPAAQPLDMNAAANAGLALPFASLRYPGKALRVRFQAVDYPILVGGYPAPYYDIVVVGVSQYTAKAYYASPFDPNVIQPPDCFSARGDVPDERAQNKQSDNCARCPRNQFGSKVTDSGKKAKACSDTRRLAVVPLSDLENGKWGGPMLLSLPTMSRASFQELANYAGKFGAQISMMAVRLSFDQNATYPRLTFQGVRWLTQAEFQTVEPMHRSSEVDMILNTGALYDEEDAETVGSPVAAGFAGRPPVPHTATVYDMQGRQQQPDATVAAQPQPQPQPAAAQPQPQPQPVAAQQVQQPQPAAAQPQPVATQPQRRPAPVVQQQPAQQQLTPAAQPVAQPAPQPAPQAAAADPQAAALAAFERDQAAARAAFLAGMRSNAAPAQPVAAQPLAPPTTAQPIMAPPAAAQPVQPRVAVQAPTVQVAPADVNDAVGNLLGTV